MDLEVAEEGRLVIGAWAGSVNVSAGGPGIVQLEVRCRGVLPPPLLEIERDGDDVYVAGRSAPSLQWLSRWAWRKAQLAVSVPARYSVEVATDGGRVEIHGVDGEVEARSRRGHLVFRNVRGPIDARTSGGSIAVSRCRGDVDATTSRGSIEIREVEGQVSAHARSGRIAVMYDGIDLMIDTGWLDRVVPRVAEVLGVGWRIVDLTVTPPEIVRRSGLNHPGIAGGPVG